MTLNSLTVYSSCVFSGHTKLMWTRQGLCVTAVAVARTVDHTLPWNHCLFKQYIYSLESFYDFCLYDKEKQV